MLKKTITYEDFDGNTLTEEFYFNISKAEAAELQFSVAGGYGDYAKRIIAGNDKPALLKLFKDFILLSYGEKSMDGKRIVKSPELSKAFSETEAYSELFMELASDADAATAFITGVLPKEYRAALKNEPSVV